MRYVKTALKNNILKKEIAVKKIVHINHPLKSLLLYGKVQGI